MAGDRSYFFNFSIDPAVRLVRVTRGKRSSFLQEWVDDRHSKFLLEISIEGLNVNKLLLAQP